MWALRLTNESNQVHIQSMNLSFQGEGNSIQHRLNLWSLICLSTDKEHFCLSRLSFSFFALSHPIHHVQLWYVSHFLPNSEWRKTIIQLIFLHFQDSKQLFSHFQGARVQLYSEGNVNLLAATCCDDALGNSSFPMSFLIYKPHRGGQPYLQLLAVLFIALQVAPLQRINKLYTRLLFLISSSHYLFKKERKKSLVNKQTLCSSLLGAKRGRSPAHGERNSVKIK